jgi:hypothetical protein
MILPKAFAVLGQAIAMEIEYNGYIYEHTWPEKGPGRMLLLASTSTGASTDRGAYGSSVLLLTKPRPQRKPRKLDHKEHLDTVQGAINTYEKFNARGAIDLKRMTLPNYKYKKFGRVKNIAYYSNKWGRPDRYIHTFDNPTYARINYTNKGINPPVILVTGKSLNITKRGIEG